MDPNDILECRRSHVVATVEELLYNSRAALAFIDWPTIFPPGEWNSRRQHEILVPGWEALYS
jgi:hypothetical protein